MADEVKDVATDTNVEDEEATNSNEDSVEETSTEDTQEDTVDLAGELEKERTAKSQILARAKKAEEELKKLKDTKAELHISNDPYFADELRLIAEGVDGQAILKAKIIARGSGITLLDAIKDPAVIAYIKDIKEIERKEKAKLGASKGSGESQDESPIRPDMTREEHQKAFTKLMGNVRT